MEDIEIKGYKIKIIELGDSDFQLLQEAKAKGSKLIGPYSYLKHQPHNSTGDYHLHIYKKGNEIFSINRSGTGHDGYSGTRIPNRVFNALKQKFSDWNWPVNQIIESFNYTFILDNMRSQLRKVSVFKHTIDGQTQESFDGYFHTFGDDPFLTGGSGGWKNKTIAIIETEDGYVRKVPVDQFKFSDV